MCIHLSVDVHLCCFHFGLLRHATMNICVQVFVWMKVFVSSETNLCRQPTCHSFKEQNRCEAWFSLNLPTRGKVANEISELRGIREFRAFNLEISKHSWSQNTANFSPVLLAFTWQNKKILSPCILRG